MRQTTCVVFRRVVSVVGWSLLGGLWSEVLWHLFPELVVDLWLVVSGFESGTVFFCRWVVSRWVVSSERGLLGKVVW